MKDMQKMHKFDPFKAQVAERLTRHQEMLEQMASTTERIHARVFREERHLFPKLNILYDTLRTPNGWRYMADAAAKGTITTTVNAIVQVPVVLLKQPLLRLSQWPNAVQVHLVVRFFGMAPQTVPTANAGLEAIFYDNFGNIVPLGEFLSQTAFGSVYDHILPTPVTDSLSSGSPSQEPAGNEGPQVGYLAVFNSNLASSSGTFNWSMSFSLAYLLPSAAAYELRPEQPSQPVEEDRLHLSERGHNHA